MVEGIGKIIAFLFIGFLAVVISGYTIKIIHKLFSKSGRKDIFTLSALEIRLYIAMYSIIFTVLLFLLILSNGINITQWDNNSFLALFFIPFVFVLVIKILS